MGKTKKISLKLLMVAIPVGVLFGLLEGFLIPPDFIKTLSIDYITFTVFSSLPSLQIIMLSLIFSKMSPSDWKRFKNRVYYLLASCISLIYIFPVLLKNIPGNIPGHFLLVFPLPQFFGVLASLISFRFHLVYGSVAIATPSALLAGYVGSMGIVKQRLYSILILAWMGIVPNLCMMGLLLTFYGVS